MRLPGCCFLLALILVVIALVTGSFGFFFVAFLFAIAAFIAGQLEGPPSD